MGPYLCLLTILAQIFEPLRSGPFDAAPWDAGEDACRRLSTLAQLWLGASLGELFGKARLRQEIVGRC
jgi:hypothetical protein